MTQAHYSVALAAPATTRLRRRRLPMVLVLVLGMLLSLFHCVGDHLPSAMAGQQSGPATVALASVLYDVGAAVPEQHLPAHAGHCLTHVQMQPAAAIALPVDRLLCTSVPSPQQAPTSLAGLPLFKPPRA